MKSCRNDVVLFTTLMLSVVAQSASALGCPCPFGCPCADRFMMGASFASAVPASNLGKDKKFTAIFDNFDMKSSEKLLSGVPSGGMLTIMKTDDKLSAFISNLSSDELEKFLKDPESVK